MTILNKPLRQSTLKKILLSTGKFWFEYNSEEIRDTSDTRIGTATHLLVLQPGLKDKIIIEPTELDNGSRIGKLVKFIHNPSLGVKATIVDKKSGFKQDSSFYECTQVEFDNASKFVEENKKFLNASSDDLVLTPKEYQKSSSMAESVLKNKHASQILSACKYFEKNILWNHRGYDFSSTLDGLGDGFIMDFKTTIHSCKRDFINDFKYIKQNGGGYAYQAAAYLKSTGFKRYIVIYVEKTEPFDVHVFEIPQSILDIGMEQFEESLDKLDSCLKVGSFDTQNEIEFLE